MTSANKEILKHRAIHPKANLYCFVWKESELRLGYFIIKQAQAKDSQEIMAGALSIKVLKNQNLNGTILLKYILQKKYARY